MIPDNKPTNSSKSVLYSEVLQRFAPEKPTPSVTQQQSFKSTTVSPTLFQQYEGNTLPQQNFLDSPQQRCSSTSYYPTQYFFSSWFIQNFIVTGANCFDSLLMRRETNSFDYIQQEGAGFKALSVAEELLEIQARDQYEPSNENLYQDLQKQAD